MPYLTKKEEEFSMKAAVVHDFKSPLSIEDVAKPEVAPDQIIVKIETSGLCHTDIHAAHGDWPVKPHLPFIPGHEGVGIVEQVGPGVIASPFPGSAMPVARASIVSLDGRPCVSNN